MYFIISYYVLSYLDMEELLVGEIQLHRRPYLIHWSLNKMAIEMQTTYLKNIYCGEI